jgi:magnesium transporter
MMKQICYPLKEDEYLSAIPCATVPADPTVPADQSEGATDYWQEIESATQDELASWIQPLGLHPLMVEDILAAGHSTLIDRYSEAIYIEFPTNSDNSDIGIGYLSIILTPHLIATVRRGRVPEMQALVQRFQNEIRLPVARTIAVLYYILDHFIDHNMQTALALRDRIRVLEKAFTDDRDTVEISAVTALKQATTALISIVEDQQYCVKALENMQGPVLDFGGQKTYIRDLAGSLEQVFRVLDRSDKRLMSLHDSYQLTMNDTSEKRLRVLTVISAIFLPLTLITSFFGMNFKGMFLLETSYGIWLATAAMVILVVLMLAYFYRKGWFD